MQNYYLSDDVDELLKWQFPTNTVLQADSFLIVFASNQTAILNELHCNFKLSSKGETLYFTNENLNLTQTFTFPSLQKNNSFGFENETSTELKYFKNPTPKNSNSAAQNFVGYSPKAIFNFISNINPTKNLEILCASDFQTFYTLNGNQPTENSYQFINPIAVDSTISVKAICYNENYINTTNAVKTIFKNESENLPLVNLNVTEKSFFNDTTGIYVFGLNADSVYPFYGANFWLNQEIECNFEFFEPQSNNYFATKTALEIHGGKGARTKPMRSLRIEADDNLGDEVLTFNFFKDYYNFNFYRLVLRNSSNDYNISHIRDAFVAKHIIKNNFNLDALNTQPINTFINGKYWGLYNLRERFDRFYFKSHYQIFKDVVILENDNYVVEGNRLEFDSIYNILINSNLSDDETYNLLSNNFDIENFIDNFIIEIFFNNTDWPRNNVKYWQNPYDKKWRYLPFDFDVANGLVSWNRVEFDLLKAVLKPEFDETHANIFRKFLENKNFKNHFINRFADLMNTSLNKNSLLLTFNEIYENIYLDIQNQFERWDADFGNWQQNINIIEAFIKTKQIFQKNYILKQFNLQNLYNIQIETATENNFEININTLQNIELPFEGTYFNGNKIEIEIKNINESKQFAYWYNELNNKKYFGKKIKVNFTNDVLLKPIFIDKQNKTTKLLSNPNSNFIEVLIFKDENESFDYKIYNQNGSIIAAKKNNFNNYINENLTHLSYGIYYLQISFANKEEIFKIVNN